MTMGIDEISLYGLSFVNLAFLGAMYTLFAEFVIQFEAKLA
jgi:hypothetical protein